MVKYIKLYVYYCRFGRRRNHSRNQTLHGKKKQKIQKTVTVLSAVAMVSLSCARSFARTPFPLTFRCSRIQHHVLHAATLC